MNFRFYFNPVSGIPLSVQKEAARKDGWHEGLVATYEEKRDSFPYQRNKLFASFRKRAEDGVWVYAFVVLVPRKRELSAIRKTLAKANAWVHEGKTGWTTKGKTYGSILEHSIDYWSRGRLTHNQAVEFGSKGGKLSVKVRREAINRMPKIDALKIWRSPDYGHAQEALDAINADDRYEPYESRSTAYRELGKRTLPSGPRPRKTII